MTRAEKLADIGDGEVGTQVQAFEPGAHREVGLLDDPLDEADIRDDPEQQRRVCVEVMTSPPVSFVDDFTDFASPDFTAAVESARHRGDTLRSYVTASKGFRRCEQFWT